MFVVGRRFNGKDILIPPVIFLVEYICNIGHNAAKGFSTCRKQSKLIRIVKNIYTVLLEEKILSLYHNNSISYFLYRIWLYWDGYSVIWTKSNTLFRFYKSMSFQIWKFVEFPKVQFDVFLSMQHEAMRGNSAETAAKYTQGFDLEQNNPRIEFPDLHLHM